MDMKVAQWEMMSLNLTCPLNDSDEIGLGLLCDDEILPRPGQGAISNEQYVLELITFAVMGVCGLSVCFLGVVGNVLSLIVLMNRKLTSSTYSFLSALAATDASLLVVSIVLLEKDAIKPEKHGHTWPWKSSACVYLFPYVQPAASIFHVTSVWLTLAFTIDRYLMICHPLRAKNFCNVRNARIAVACLFVGSILYNFPRFLEYETVDVKLPFTSEVKTVCDLTSFGRNATFRKVYHSWLNVLLVFAIPCLSLIVLNWLLFRAVGQSKSRARSMQLSVSEKRGNDTTIMLVGVVFLFLVCQIPALVSRTIWALSKDPTVTFQWIPLYTINEIANLMILLNSAFNIVPYYFFGARFRKIFWETFCCCFLSSRRFQQHYRCPSLTSVNSRRNSASLVRFLLRGGRNSTPHSCSPRRTARFNRSNSVAGPFLQVQGDSQSFALRENYRSRSHSLTPAVTYSV